MTDGMKSWRRGDTILAVRMDEEIVICAVHHANDLAAAAHAERPKKTFEEMVPEEYRSFRDLFSKENFNEMPERTPWDHAIELVPNAKATLDCKVYPLKSRRTRTVGQVPRRELSIGSHPPLQVSLCLSFLLHQKEGWNATTRTGLPEAQRDDDQKPISPPSHFRTH